MWYYDKLVGGKTRRYLVESYRDDKTGRQKRRIIAYIGCYETVEARIVALESKFVESGYTNWRFYEQVKRLKEVMRLSGFPRTHWKTNNPDLL